VSKHKETGEEAEVLQVYETFFQRAEITLERCYTRYHAARRGIHESCELQKA